MSFASLAFLVFLAVCVAGYYLIPRRLQWVWLLIFSYIYYLAAGPGLVVFLLFSTATSFIGSRFAARQKKSAVVITLLLNFGCLFFLKYTNFLIANLNGWFGLSIPAFRILLPLGISFYIFQSSGYLLDVYWKRCELETNPLRYALFVSFFPQIMQGPIGRHAKLAGQLYAEHRFDAERIKRGLWRILWGFFKKMLIADNAGLYANLIFDQYAQHPAYAIQGVLMYCAQLYADFSGGIDIVIGIAEMFGIELDENFRQPFFARSIGDFWRRWHITLGSWMKDYLFYPLSLSKWMGRFGKWCRKHLGKTVGRALPISIANIIVFLVVGIWHGPAWHFIIYGLYNGLIIGISGLLAKPYRSWKKALHIDDKSRGFIAFQIIRTFLLVNLSWFFDRAETLPQAFSMIASCFKKNLFSITMIKPEDPASAYLSFAAIVIGCVALLVHSILKERDFDLRGALMQKPAAARIAIALILIFSLGILGLHRLFGGFIYANF